MRIYVNILPINIDLNKLHNFSSQNKQYKMVYSDDGVFKIENSTIFYFAIKNESYKIINIKNLHLYCDMSDIIYEKTNYIPINHKMIDINLHKYKINNNISLSIEYVNNKIYNMYFDVTNSDSVVIKTIEEILDIIN